MSLDLNLGIDFGTSFTKVCVRDTARETSWIVRFDNSQSLEGALLPTKIGISHDGSILTGLTQSEWEQQPTDQYTTIDFIKMRLANCYLRIDKEGWQFPSLPEQPMTGVDLTSAEVIENLCAYYLSSIISRSKDWIMEHNKDLVRNQEINWSVNIGVPVQYADSGAIAGFQNVLCLSWLLSEAHLIQMSVNQLDTQLNSLRQNLANNSDLPCFAIPEVAAAVYSYTTSRQAETGTYVFFDIGGGTVEGASFRFWREDDMPKVDFYVGTVEPLGVHAIVKHIAEKMELTDVESEIEAFLIQNNKYLRNDIDTYSKELSLQLSSALGDFVANRWRISERAINEELQTNLDEEKQRLLHFMLKQQNIHQQVGKVIMQTKAKIPEYYRTSVSAPIFVGGGGSAIEFYQTSILDTREAFDQHCAGIPPYHARSFPIPADLKDRTSQQQFHRFSVAYGLSIPEYEMPEVKLPRLFAEKPIVNAALNLGSATDGEYILAA
jgi:hypothetical protein